RRASAACASKARARTESSAGGGAVGSRGRRARDRVRGRRRGDRRAPRVRAQHARLPVRGLPQRPRGAEGAAGTGRPGHSPAAAAGRRPPRARRLLDPRRPAARAPGDVSRRLHDGARDRRGAAARPRGGCPRLPREADQPARGPREDQALGREVTSRQFLLIVAITQGALLVALVILIILNRWVRVRRRAQIHPRRTELDGLMQRWSLGQAPSVEVLRALARLPVPVAIDALVTWSARIGGERWQELSRGLENQGWARAVRASSRSARWWKRLDCARFLSVAATSRDIGRVLRLLHDHHPAVQIAAATTLERVGSAALVTAALEQLPFLGPTVQAYYASVLKRARPAVLQHLQKLFRRLDDPRLPRLIEFAGRLEEPVLREAFTTLATHPEAEVRTQVARALGKFPHSESVAALGYLVADESWPVRAQAARSLGMIADPKTLPAVREALRDPEWWVRLRAGLALTRFGAAGRN